MFLVSKKKKVSLPSSENGGNVDLSDWFCIAWDGEEAVWGDSSQYACDCKCVGNLFTLQKSRLHVCLLQNCLEVKDETHRLYTDYAVNVMEQLSQTQSRQSHN
jgi:hypothetical protein